MRILVLSSHTPSLFWFRMDMMKFFLRLGCEVFAVGNEEESKWQDRFAENHIIYKQIYVQRNGINPFHDLKTLTSIQTILKEIKPDKIFSYQAKTVIYGGIAANLLGIKEVYPLIAGVGSTFLKDDRKSRLIRKILITEYRLSMRNSPAVFFQNRDDEAVFQKNHILKRQRIVMIPGSGVNLDRFKVQPLPKDFAFLYIGRLIRDKGICEYLEASRKVKKEYPEVRFLLVGPYDSNPSAITKNELRSYLDDGTVEYFSEQEDVRPFLAQCQVFVLPSYREGTPKTNLEAMACGRAIITTDAPGCRETVTDGENGFLVPIKDIDALCEKMKTLIKNPDLAASMGSRGRRKAEEFFDVKIVDKIISETMELITR